MIEVPAIATGVWLLGRLGIANGDASFMHLVRISAVFAGIAAVLTAGGVGRVAAFASVDRIGGRRHAVFKAARTHAVAGAGLVLIATIPHGHLPGYGGKWLVILIVGAGIGWCCGALIGLVCGGAAPVGIAEVMALARTPGHALRQLLDPEDLMKIGAAVRHRTQQMFGGMFDPAKPPPPADKDDKPAEDKKP